MSIQQHLLGNLDLDILGLNLCLIENAQEEFEKIVQDNIHLPAELLCSTLFDRLNDYRGDTVQFDDMTLLVVEVND